MKKYLLIVAGAIILLIIVFFLQAYIRSNFDLFAKNATVKINDETLQLELADTPEKRQIGLSGKNSLSDDRGMLFVFDSPDIYNFWMKDMDFPIDIIFLRDNKIVTIHKNVPAPENNSQNLKLYSPKEPSNRVVELNAGNADEHGLKEGQVLDIKL